MLNRWKSLTQDNKVKLIGIVLAAALSAIGYIGIQGFQTTEPVMTEQQDATDTKAATTQTTFGNHSSTFSGIKGDVTININDPEPTQ